MKMYFYRLAKAVGILLVLLNAFGCAANKSFSIKDSNISNIKVAYHKSPKFQWNTTRGLPVLILFGSVGAEVWHASSPEKKIYPTEYSQYIMLNFVEKVKYEIPKWPAMTVIEQPINEDYAEANNVLEIKVSKMGYAFIVGFVSETTATLKDNGGNIIWQKNYLYKSSYYNRKRSLEEYEADNYKLLKEEMEFAANMTVKDFIEHLKGGL